MRKHTRLPLIAKIEKPQAVDAAEEIIRAADCVMVARGDLGIELPIEDVPMVQKQLLRIAGRLARPSITATQMLDSMVSSSRPTRAEVADVANAILDGTDAVMLSQETAIGAYPVEAVEMMAAVAERTEHALPYRSGTRSASGATPATPPTPSPTAPAPPRATCTWPRSSCRPSRAARRGCSPPTARRSRSTPSRPAVQPPAPGQTTQAVTTTVTPAVGVAANAPATAPVATGQPVTAGQTDASGQPVAAPAAGTAPIVRPADVNIAAGTNLTIRINQHISVKSSRAGDRFDGEVVEPVVGNNDRVVIPRGSPVSGVVVASHRRGHFKGSSILELRLTYLTLNGTRYALDTRDLTQTKKGKGKRSAAFIGGGTGAGMLVGGVAAGGVGLLIGGLAGAGGGTLLGGLTGNRDIDIPAESIVRFKLADNLVVQPS